MENKYDTTCPLFKLKILGNTSVICKHIGYYDTNEKLEDGILEIEGNKQIVKFKTFGKYDLLLKGHICHIPGSYLLKNKKLPIYYITIMYCSQFVVGHLYSVFLYFNIDEETCLTLKTPKNYVNKRMTGNFTIELITDDIKNDDEYIFDKKKKEIENNVMNKYLEQFNKCEKNEEREELMNNINKEIDNVFLQCKKMFEPIVIQDESMTRNKIIGKMKHILTNDEFNSMIRILLNKREEDRIKEYNMEMEHDIPTNTVNIMDLNDDEKINKHVESLIFEDD